MGYVRLHGRNYEQWFQEREEGEGAEQCYNYLYSVQELEPWAERIRHVAASARSTFVVTNNHFRGKAVTNALQLLHLLKRTWVKVPPPLLQLYPEELDPIASGEGITPSLFPPG